MSMSLALISSSALPDVLMTLALGVGIGVGVGLRLKRDYTRHPILPPPPRQRPGEPSVSVWRALLGPTLLAMGVALAILGFCLGGLPGIVAVTLLTPFLPLAITSGPLGAVIAGGAGVIEGYIGMGIVWWAAHWLIKPAREIISPIEYAIIAGLGLGSGLGFVVGIVSSDIGGVALGAEVGLLGALTGILMLRSRWAAA